MSFVRAKSTTTLTAAVLCAALLAGCSSGDDAKSDSDAQGDPTAAPPTAEVNEVTVTRTADLSPAIVQDGKTSRTGQQVTVGFAGLKAEGKIATLTLVFTPDLQDVEPDEEISLLQMFDDHVKKPTLVDMGNFKRYKIAEDGDGNELGADLVDTRTVNKQPVAANYTFGAPAVDVVDIYLGDQLVFDNVEVER